VHAADECLPNNGVNGSRPVGAARLYCWKVFMGKRGTNHFRLNDARRAIRSARDAGLEPSSFDIIVGKDGSTTFRVYGGGAMPAQTAATREWEAATAAVIEKSKRAEKKATRTAKKR
jgi:hypothetical protein